MKSNFDEVKSSTTYFIMHAKKNRLIEKVKQSALQVAREATMYESIT
jgi:hypothetical protein